MKRVKSTQKLEGFLAVGSGGLVEDIVVQDGLAVGVRSSIWRHCGNQRIEIFQHGRAGADGASMGESEVI
ncbi:MAG: hypothetical protein FJ210_01315 [Betaproteobacteria bacterium]|nr:hypothetical protein [Betaproteobacteria bacterium]